MSRMKRRNARNILLKVCDQFHKVTGETVGITYTWAGSLDIFRTSNFRKIIVSKKDEIWRSLTFQRSSLYQTTFG